MYNWDDPINDALSKPDIVPEKKSARSTTHRNN